MFFNGSFSFPITLQCGVPQGSCLGPLLFSIFINDLPYVLNNCTATLFADDTTIHFASTIISELSNTFQLELQLVVNWICENRLVLNVTKAKSILFRSRHATNGENQLCLSLTASNTEQIQEVNLLGVTLDGMC